MLKFLRIPTESLGVIFPHSTKWLLSHLLTGPYYLLQTVFSYFPLVTEVALLVSLLSYVRSVPSSAPRLHLFPNYVYPTIILVHLAISFFGMCLLQVFTLFRWRARCVGGRSGRKHFGYIRLDGHADFPHCGLGFGFAFGVFPWQPSAGKALFNPQVTHFRMMRHLKSIFVINLCFKAFQFRFSKHTEHQIMGISPVV